MSQETQQNKSSARDFDEFYNSDHAHFSIGSSCWLEEFVKTLRQRKEKRALDLGCGHGRNSLYLAKQGFEVMAVDNSEHATEFLKKKLCGTNFPIRVMRDRMQDIEIKPESLDLALMITSLGDIPSDELSHLTGKIVRGMRKGGLVAVEEFSPSDPGATGKTGASELAHLVTRYFSAEEISELFSTLKPILCTQLEVLDRSHGLPHYHSLVRYVGKKQ